MKTVRIGNAAGFWGDSPLAPQRLADAGELDYLTLEYLAELTMSILAHLKSRDPDAGYVTDFPPVLETLVDALRNQPQLRIVTNAGGMNPTGCAIEAARVLAGAGLGDVAVAAVAGDDLFPRIEELFAAGEAFANLDTGAEFGNVREDVVSANAYLGAAGIVDALAQGARIVVTGRVADASLTVGPAVHEFGWKQDDWGRLAGATVAGHLIECGAQVTGGMYSDWSPDVALEDVGYPISELADDGTCVVTKPAGTGGGVNVQTVCEQLVYEIGDPAHYLTPDVDVDFTNVRLTQDGENRVRVNGARGAAPPETLKVSAAYRDGFLVEGTLVICGRGAVARARACAETVFGRVRRAGYELSRTNVECLGAGDSLPGMDPIPARDGDQPHEPWEVVLRIAAHDPSREAVECLARELAPLVTSGPPGVTGYTGGRPKPRPVLSYWPTTIARSHVSPALRVSNAKDWI